MRTLILLDDARRHFAANGDRLRFRQTERLAENVRRGIEEHIPVVCVEDWEFLRSRLAATTALAIAERQYAGEEPGPRSKPDADGGVPEEFCGVFKDPRDAGIPSFWRDHSGRITLIGLHSRVAAR